MEAKTKREVILLQCELVIKDESSKLTGLFYVYPEQCK